MPQILMLTVTGGGRPYFRKIVSVEDPTRFLGHIRARVLKEQIDEVSSAHWVTAQQRENYQAEQLRTLKVKLYELNLKDYPETDTEVEEVYRRFDRALGGKRDHS